MTTLITAVTMPKWGLEMTEGSVAGWLKSVGDPVVRGEPLVEIESDKIVNALDAPAAGVLRRILLQASTTAVVGDLIGVIADADVPETALDEFVTGFQGPAVDDGRHADTAAPTRPPVASPSRGAGTDAPVSDATPRVSPPVRRRAEELGVDLSLVPGSGSNGRITREDVERAAGRVDAASATVAVPDGGPAPVRRTPLSAARRTIGRRMQQAASTIPHFYLTVDVDASTLLARRKTLAEAGTRASFNDLLAHALARTLARHPRINARLEGDTLAEHAHVHLAVAMAAGDALVAPVVQYADRLELPALVAALGTLRRRAEQRTLTGEDVEHGTFTLSNLGMFGVRQFTSIITPPQVASLAAGCIAERWQVDGGRGTATPMLTLTLSCDHRAVDGATGATFLQALRADLESTAPSSA